MGGKNKGGTSPSQKSSTCSELGNDLNNITPTITSQVSSCTRALGSLKDANGNIRNLCGTSISSAMRGKSFNIQNYELALGPQDADYSQILDDNGTIEKDEGLTLCAGADKFFPSPRNKNAKSQRRSSHAEVGVIFNLAQNGLLQPKTSLKLRIDWPNNGPYPCPRCARMLCTVANECEVDIVICNEQHQETRPFADKENCKELNEVCETPGKNMKKSDPYGRIVDVIRGV